MSDSSKRGKDFELKVQKLTSKILHLETKRDSRSGAGFHKQDIRDRYDLLPLFIECKDQESLGVKKEWRIADAKSSYGQAPVVIFPDNEEVLCVIRFEDLLNIVRESMDWKDTADHLREPPQTGVSDQQFKQAMNKGLSRIVEPVVEKKIQSGAKQCRAGHIADDFGYCMQLTCKYSRGYRPPKVKKK